MFVPLRRIRFGAALVALVSLLFMQLAVARYVCPVAAAGPAGVKAAWASPQVNMPCADAMAQGLDDAQPNLCKAHCELGQQSADTYQLPPLAVLSAWPVVYPAAPATPALRGVPLLPTLLQRSTDPPLAVRNCCFRI